MLRRGKRERLFSIYSGMLTRCRNPNHAHFKKYGGRGIGICEEWSDYSVFRSWALANGYAEKLTLDRKDNDGNYEPSNCRWATGIEQQNNKRNNILVVAFGETKSRKQWTYDARCIVGYQCLRGRLARGVNPEVAMTEPLHPGQVTHGRPLSTSVSGV